MDDRKKFKIKLIFPCSFKNLQYYYLLNLTYHFPYGIGILTAFLRKNHYLVEQVDLSLKFQNLDLTYYQYRSKIDRFLERGEINNQLNKLLDKIIASTSITGFDLFGFSILSYGHYIFSLLFSKKIKQISNVPIVFGGPFMTLFSDFYKQTLSHIDFVILGDGCIPLLRLMDYLNEIIPISDVPNLIYKDSSGNFIENFKEYYQIEDMLVPEFGDLFFEFKNHKKLNQKIALPYQISRGCSGQCNFCNHRQINNRLEFKTPEKVINELICMKQKYHCNIFHFRDSNINNSYEYLENLCELFIKNKLNIYWFSYAKIDSLDRKILKKMKEAGCVSLIFGIESGSNRMLQLMNKGFTVQQASQTLYASSVAGIKNLIIILLGYPHETQEDINQTKEFIRKNRLYINNIVINEFVLQPGNPLYFHSGSYGVKNIILVPHEDYFAFDEINGLSWEQKKIQRSYFKKQIMFAAYKYLMLNWKLKNFVNLFGAFYSSLKIKLINYAL